MWKEKFIQYLRYEKSYSSHTEISYLNDLSQFERYVRRETGGFDPASVDPDLVRGWIVDLMSGKMKPRSATRKLSAVKSFFRYLKKQGLVAKNPAEHVSGPKTDKKLPAFVRGDEMDAVIDDENAYPDNFEGHRDRFLIELLYLTGMRRAELISLQDADVDFFSSTLRVTGKRNKQRIIPLSASALQKMKQYMEVRDAEIENKSPHLFVRKDGRPLYPALVYKVVRTHLDGVRTLSRKSPHVLRHTFATEMLNNGAEINSVKELLGHSSLASTEVYTHVTFEELKKVYHNAHPRAKK